ncbi:anthrone oxygenase family protein [Streptomyces sp. NPDC094468]|uniref:anthrone oxygenase family protein n=1 Tax=Streptomyces sp. NPDC094468 TaxID=3366066 RepID=UPI00381E4977
MLTALEVFTTVVVGVMVGVEFSVAFFVNRIFDGLPGDDGLRARTHGARLLGTVMPFWYVGALALAAVWAVAGRHRDGAGLVVAAVALLVVSVVMSVLLLVPINNRVRTWTADGLPAGWKRQMNRWDRLHHVRVAVIVAAFTLLAAALA